MLLVSIWFRRHYFKVLYFLLARIFIAELTEKELLLVFPFPALVVFALGRVQRYPGQGLISVPLLFQQLLLQEHLLEELLFSLSGLLQLLFFDPLSLVVPTELVIPVLLE